MDCLFCSIADGSIPSDKVYEDEKALIFRDIAPMAPVHLLAIPKVHVSGFSEISVENAEIIAHVMTVIAKVAAQQGLESYRVVSNCGADAGQTVGHLHFHILGGHKLGVFA